MEKQVKRNKGWDKPPSVRKKISVTMKQKGLRPPDHHCYKGHKDHGSPNERNGSWKGDAVGYFALRMWLTRNYGKPDHCDNPDCHYPRKNYDGVLMVRPKRYEWFYVGEKNTSKRDRKFWITYCPSCHRTIKKQQT